MTTKAEQSDPGPLLPLDTGPDEADPDFSHDLALEAEFANATADWPAAEMIAWANADCPEDWWKDSAETDEDNEDDEGE